MFYTCFLDLLIYYVPIFVQKWRRCILVEILNQSELGAFSYKIYTNYFFNPKNFPYFSLTTNYAICMFWCKNADFVLRSKFLTSRTKGHFRTNFTRFFFVFFFYFFSIQFSNCFWDHWIYYLLVFGQKCWNCIPVEILDLSKLGLFSYEFFMNFFFSFWRNFPFFSWTTKYAICKF